MGHIIGPFGVYGWVKVNPYTEYIDGLMQYSIWCLSKDNKDWQKLHVVSGSMNGSILNAKFAENTDRTQAFALNEMKIRVARSHLHDLS